MGIYYIYFVASGDGECILPSGQIVNPLKLQDSISYDDIDIFQSAISTSLTLPHNHTIRMRNRRDTEKVVNTRTIIDKDGHRHQVVSMVIILCFLKFKINYEYTLKLKLIIFYKYRIVKQELQNVLILHALYIICKENKKQL